MDKEFIYKDSAIFYRVYGNGKPVVLLHGLPATGTLWQPQIDFLKERYSLIVPDLPGSGKSEILKAESASMSDYADCIEALLDKEKVEDCILLGHSMGGYIALAFAEKYANRLKGFGLVHSTAYADTQERKEKRKQGIEIMKQYGIAAFIEKTTPPLFGKAFSEKHPEKVKAFIDANKNANGEAFKQYYVSMMNRPDRTNVLIHTAGPVLFIAGTEDTAVPLNDILKQAHLPETSYIYIGENAGHLSMIEDIETLNKKLLTFIEGVYKESA